MNYLLALISCIKTRFCSHVIQGNKDTIPFVDNKGDKWIIYTCKNCDDCFYPEMQNRNFFKSLMNSFKYYSPKNPLHEALKGPSLLHKQGKRREKLNENRCK